MSTNSIDNIFCTLKNEFDIDQPRLGHQERFLEKLSHTKTITSNKSIVSLWKPWLGIAASFTILFMLFIGLNTSNSTNDLANISPEMANTEAFFTTSISYELEKLNKEDNPKYQKLVSDAMYQLKVQEEIYETLKIDLSESGNDNRVITAMISNFQNRINILQHVLQQIETLKQQNNLSNENSITI